MNGMLGILQDNILLNSKENVALFETFLNSV